VNEWDFAKLAHVERCSQARQKFPVEVEPFFKNEVLE
jgi:hypothetical protein